jgi:large subunit ribosomal protein L25
MEHLELTAEKRDVIGKKVRFIRREGQTPANLYGHGVASTALKLDTRNLSSVLAHAGQTDLISLKVGSSKKAVKVLVREVQRDPLSEELLHVDFYQGKLTEKLKVDVPLSFSGEAPALKIKNTSLLYLMDSLPIEALPDDLPHNVDVDLSALTEVDQAIHIKDIALGQGVTLLGDPEQMVVKVTETRGVREEEGAEEEGAEGAAAEAEAAPEQ